MRFGCGCASTTPVPQSGSVQDPVAKPAHKRRILMVAPYFPPRRRVGALRPYKFALHLADLGWEPTVLHLANPGQHLTPREQELLRGVELKAMGKPSSTPKPAKARSTGAQESQAGWSGPRKLVDRLHPVDSWWAIHRWHAWRLQSWVKELKPDVVWSTADPWSSHLLGERLSQAAGVPWVADFRDPWSLCAVRLEERPAWVRRIDAAVEKRWLKQASHVVFTAQQTTERYLKAYPDLNTPISTIRNSFERQCFEEPPVHDVHPLPPDGVFRMLFFGAFRRLSPATPVIQLLAALKSLQPELLERVRVQSTAPLEPSDQAFAESLGVHTCFETIDPVPYEQALRVLAPVDLLLLSTEPRRDEIIPAKLWDYLCAGKPIFALCNNPEVHGIVQQAHAGRAFRTDGEMGDAAKHLADRIKGENPDLNADSRAHVALDGFSSRRATEKLVEILRSVSSHG